MGTQRSWQVMPGKTVAPNSPGKYLSRCADLEILDDVA